MENTEVASASETLIRLRRVLHRQAELSGHEVETEKILLNFLSEEKADTLLSGIAGHGILAVFHGRKTGKTILLRCDTDAIPVNEEIDIPYCSQTSGVSHKCGHDGHMTILAGVAQHLTRHPLDRGTVLLLFQPGEETGTGARAVLADPAFQKYTPDMVFALHNLPGYPAGSVVTADGSFASASRGMIIHLKGRSSHAAEPEKGISPAPSVAELIAGFQKLENIGAGELVTVTHISMGMPSLGVSPENAVVMAVLRAPSKKLMDSLASRAEVSVRDISQRAGLKLSLEWQEEFPATENDPVTTALIRRAAANCGMHIISLDRPFLWSEDFGHFTEAFTGALFGLGSGTECPALHSSLYDFPEQITGIGVQLFVELLETAL